MKRSDWGAETEESQNPQPEGLNIIKKYYLCRNDQNKKIMAYTQIIYHIVLRTKRSEQSIAQENVSSLYKYIWGIIKNKKGKLYRINGIEDHIHILSDLHPSFALSDFVKSIKVATSLWMKQSADFPLFRGWEEGYAAFTYSYKEKEVLIRYIKNQQNHHQKEDTHNELKRLWKENGMEQDERYFT